MSSGLNLKELFKILIDNKYNELVHKLDNGNFALCYFFGVNIIGQIGESFIKNIFHRLNIKITQGSQNIIHNEYDIQLENGIKIEIKTARQGLTSGTFQFNGINPKYEYDYFICLGICADKILYKIFKKNITYNSKNCKWLIKINNNTYKSLIAMNPKNKVNYKLILYENELNNIDKFINEIISIF